MTDKEFDRFIELLDTFDHAMLVTLRNQELRSRPMVVADRTDDGRLRFVTRDDRATLADLDEHSQVNVSLQGDSRFLSIAGNARATRDPAVVKGTCQGGRVPWFSTSPDDPHLIVLEVLPVHAEYWDEAAGGVVEQLFRGRNDAEVDHGDIDFSST